MLYIVPPNQIKLLDPSLPDPYLLRYFYISPLFTQIILVCSVCQVIFMFDQETHKVTNCRQYCQEINNIRETTVALIYNLQV